MSPSPDDRIDLVTRNLQEVLGEAHLKEIMQKRPLRIYWGTATTGKPHIAYFVPICKIADFLHAGCEVTILFADMHAYLDNMKAPWELLKLRAEYYEKIIKSMLKSIGVDLTKLKFIKGTEYQLSKEYTLDVYRMASIVTQHDAKKAGAEVVKQVESPLLSGLLYPCLQALDEQYLDVDAQFGGVDQRKIFTFAEKHLPMLGYRKRIHLMNPMVPGLAGNKMSASEEYSKIDLLDGPDVVKKKIKKAFCEPGNVDNNWVLAFAKHVVFPTLQFGNRSSSYKVQRSEANGGTVEYSSYDDLEKDFANTLLHPSDLKASMIEYVNHLLEPILEDFKSADMQKLVEQAYSAVQKTDNVPSTRVNGDSGINPAILDLCVGHILSTEKHPSADSLLVHQVQVDPGSVRTVCSGLLPYINESEWPKMRSCVVLRNIKPVNMRGVESYGMILAMCRDKPEKMGSLLKPHEGTRAGDKVWVDGFDGPDQPKQLISKKQWDKLQPYFSVDQDGTVSWNESPVRTDDGSVTCELRNGSVR